MLRILRSVVCILFVAQASIFAADSIGPIGGNPRAMTTDAQGNLYIVGNFSLSFLTTETIDFDPGAGVDNRTAGLGAHLFVTKFNANGSYAWTQTGSLTGLLTAGDLTGIAVAGSTVYVTGWIQGGAVPFGTPSTNIPNTNVNTEDGFVLALNTTNGNFVPAFGVDGIVTIGGTNSERANGLTFLSSSNTLYVVGNFASNNPTIDGVALTQNVTGAQCAFALALDLTNGARVTTFSGDGFQFIGGDIGVPSGNPPGITNGNAIAIGTSIVGGIYITGSYSATGLGIGTLSVAHPSIGGYDAYVAALNFDGTAQNSASFVKFGSDGIQTFGGSFDDRASAILATDSTVYLLGDFSSTNAGFGSAGTTSIVGGAKDVFVAALTGGQLTAGLGGQPRSDFSLDGVQVFGGSKDELGYSMLLTSAALFITGEMSSSNAGVGGTDNISTTGGRDAFVLALDSLSGESINTFHGDGVLTYGGLSSEIGRALALRGSRLLLAGEQASGQAGFEGPGTIGIAPYKSFLADLDAAGDGLANAPVVQGGVLAVALDAAGNTYIAGEFANIADFNPQAGADVRSSRSTDTFVTRFSADGRYAWTQTFGGTAIEKVGGLTVANGTVYLAGRFAGTGAGFNGTGTLNPVGTSDAFVAALNAATGAPVASFGVGGIQTFGGGGNDEAKAIAVLGTTVYVACVYSNSGTVQIGTTGSALLQKGGLDTALVALDGATGAPVSAFGTSGAVVFGGTSDDTPNGITVSSDGTIYVCGLATGGTGGFGSTTTTTITPSWVFAVSASNGAPVTAFSGDGIQTFAGFTPSSVSTSSTGLFVGGFGGGLGPSQINVGDGTVVSIPTVGIRQGVLKLDRATGACATAFGDGGVQLIFGSLGSGDMELTVSGSTVFQAGFFQTANLGIGAAGTTSTAGLNDGYVAAMDTTTGAAVNAFGVRGIKTFGGSADDTFKCITSSNGIVAAGGTTASANAGFNGLGPFDGTGFGGVVTTFNAVSGAGTRIVINTNDTGPGSLRDALKFSFAGDRVEFDSSVFALDNSDAATVINVFSPLPALDKGNLTIDAQDRRVTVNGTAAGSASGLLLTSSNNVVRGLSVVGFTSSGVTIRGGAKSNIIGGSRAVGMGPNGQGLRIANCGAFGVEISGLGTDSNSVKGCWIGLDAAGMAGIPNLAGVLIQDGAKTNVIGSTDPNEMNVISGNSFEGVTISGAGTDDNEILGNIIGFAAVDSAVSQSGAMSRDSNPLPTRASIGNGSAGAFISKGTQGSKLGGEEDGKGNTIANNGGSGLEVRTANTRRNAARKNRITRNQRGGITLFDGSNNGVTAPTFTSVAQLENTGTLSRGKVKVKVSGSAARDGVVDIFGDDAGQGGLLVGRAACVNGVWEAEIEIDDLLNLTATLTDLDGNTSPFGDRGPALDGDKDGVSDELELLAGTDPNNASDVPVLGGGLVVDKVSIGLAFTKPTDKLKLDFRLIVPVGYVNNGAAIGVKIAGLSEKITLVGKGTGAANSATLKVSGAPSSAAPPETAVKMTFSVGKKDLETFFVDVGLTNRTTAKIGEQSTLPVTVTISAAGKISLYTGTVNVLYKASQGKTGKAAKVKAPKV